jgi:DNA-binding CsgD family transcriptional regulator/GAF domain-containing protein
VKHPADISPDTLLDIVSEIYDATINPEKWSEICERIGRLVSGDQTAIALHDTGSNQVRVSAGWNIDPGLETAMQANFHINPLVPAIWHVEICEPFTSFGYLGEDGFKNSRFYKTVAQPHRLGDSALTVLAKSVNKFGALSIQRRDHQPAFLPDEIAILRQLAPHVRRAVMISDLMDSRAIEKDLLAATLDRLAVSIILADGEGRIAHTNEAAERRIEQGELIRLPNAILTVRDQLAARELSMAIREAGSGTRLDVSRTRAAIPIKGRTGRDLIAWVLPLDSGPRREVTANPKAAVAVFIRDIADTAPFPAELFVRRYGITPAESRVMSLLVQGMTIQEAAETLGISVPTAKTHLAHLFSKTGTGRQTDLVRLAMGALSPVSE